MFIFYIFIFTYGMYRNNAPVHTKSDKDNDPRTPDCKLMQKQNFGLSEAMTIAIAVQSFPEYLTHGYINLLRCILRLQRSLRIESKNSNKMTKFSEYYLLDTSSQMK